MPCSVEMGWYLCWQGQYRQGLTFPVGSALSADCTVTKDQAGWGLGAVLAQVAVECGLLFFILFYLFIYLFILVFLSFLGPHPHIWRFPG